MPAEDRRPDPDALLLAAAGEGRGRLKIFLGSAPGVGKTWEMLVQAKRRLKEGADVLAGVIETHGRAGTEAELQGVPLLPQREVPYRGQILREFDLDAALARRPALLLVDELAHTNAPGSQHAKRWEDVEALLEAGLDVWATLNVQHLESLNEDVARITGVRVTETLPDRVLELADEIELIDVPATELRARLREGKIYRADNAARALDGFFKEGNLAALREIALRRTAAHVDDDVRDWMRRAGVAGPWPAGDRVMALVGPDKAAEGVVRHAKRLAEALHAPWTALHVERDNTIADARAALALAAQLGADVQTRLGSDLVSTTVDFARAANVTHLVMGRTPAPLWRRLTGRVLSVQLLRRAPDFVLHVIPAPGFVLARRRRPPAGWIAWGAAAALVAGTTGFGLLLRDVLPGEAMGLAYLAAVVAGASLGGLRPALAVAAAGFLAWDYFFIPPIYQISISSVRDVMALLLFAGVAVLAGSLASRVRAEARAAQARIEGLRRIGTFSRKLGEAATEPELLAELARQAAAIAGRGIVLAPIGEGSESQLDIRAAEPPADTMDEGAWAASRWAWTKQETAGQGTSTLPSASWRFMPLKTARAPLGVLGVRSATALNEPQSQALAALGDQAAVAWERVRLAVEAAQSTAMEETQRLRTALLASLGHDLRTPLTAIQGAAGTLKAGWAQLEEATRADLLDSIDQDVARMARFLSNITELTRLETGQIKPRMVAVEVAGAVEAAASRLAETPFVSINMGEPEPVALADPVLLEQVLVNILENAAKYAPPHSPIQVRGRREGTEVLITVADEGVGIQPDDMPHIFDSFFRASRGDRVPPGTGLGLAIARGLIEAMGGRIEAHSPRPDLPADGRPGDHRDVAPARGQAGVVNESRILVIDDEPQIHRFLKPALETAGYTVERADTAAEGLRLAAARVPAAILLDLGLPDQDGQDTLLELRSLTHAPILVVSARDHDAEKVRALDGGADDYVEKPFAMPELLARLRACLRRALVQEGVVQPFRRQGIEVDLLKRRVRSGEDDIVLTPREYDLLALLVRNAGRVITHRQLLTSVWGPAHAEDVQYLRVYVGHLRQKLGQQGGSLIRTEPGVGYRFAEAETDLDAEQTKR